MQHRFLILIIMLVALEVASLSASGFKLGLKGGVGVNHSTGRHAKSLVPMGSLNMEDLLIDSDQLPYDQIGSIRGNIGLLLGYNINNYVGIMSNLFVGLNNSRAVGDMDRHISMSYHSIDLDLLLKVMFPLSFGRFYLAGGPMIAWGVSKLLITDSSQQLNLSHDYQQSYTNPLWAIAAELGFEIDVKHGSILLAIRSQWNLTKMGPLIAVSQHVPLSFQTGYIFKFK